MPQLVASPTSVDFGSVLSGQTETRQINVTWDGTTAVPINVSSPFSVSPSSVPPGGGAITVSYAASGARRQAGAIRFRGHGEVRIRLVGTSINPIEVVSSHESGDEDQNPATAQTLNRFRLYVPTFDTQLVMGRRFAGLTGNAYNGCGLGTTGDIFVNAHGDESRLWMQAKKDVLLQSSSESVYTLAAKDNVIAGKGSASMMSGGGVLIVAGHGEEPVSANGTDPPDIQGIKDLRKNRGTVATAFAALDGALSFIAAGRALYGIWQDRENVHNKRMQTALSALGAAANVVGGSLSFAGFEPATSLPSTVVYGAGGVMLASPAFSGFYSGSGLVLMSLYPFLAGLDAEVLAINAVSLTGYGTAKVSGRKSALIDSGNHVRVEAGKATGGDGMITMQAKDIWIGQGRAVGGAMVRGSLRTEHIVLGTKSDENTIEIKDRPGTISLGAKRSVRVDVGDWHITVKKDQITIGRKDGVPAVKIGPKNITLTGQEVLAKDEANGQVKVKNGELKLIGKAARIL